MLGVNGETWKWRERLFASEEDQVGKFCEFLTSIVLQVHVDDLWV